jgi:hypothetical protein
VAGFLLAGAKGFEPSIFSVTGRRVNRATPRTHACLSGENVSWGADPCKGDCQPSKDVAAVNGGPIVSFILKDHYTIMPTHEQQLNRILTVTLDIQTTVTELGQRVARLEDASDRTFDKIDGFLVLVQRHEAEISALRSAYDRRG